MIESLVITVALHKDLVEAAEVAVGMRWDEFPARRELK